jgi:ribose-phosphate pyrophosphokinase
MKGPVKLIVDDICDGGATFIGIADAIHEKDPDADVRLYVTHGIFSKGIDVFKGKLNHIYVSNVFPDIPESESNFITEV